MIVSLVVVCMYLTNAISLQLPRLLPSSSASSLDVPASSFGVTQTMS